MQTDNSEHLKNAPVPGHTTRPIDTSGFLHPVGDDWRSIHRGPAPTDQVARPPMKGNQRRIIAAEQFITDVLEGLHTIATERRILRRAVERANIETDGKSFLAEVLDLTTPASVVWGDGALGPADFGKVATIRQVRVSTRDDEQCATHEPAKCGTRWRLHWEKPPR